VSELKRFGVSLEGNLLEEFDRHIRQMEYPTRSKAIADLIRKDLVQKQWRAGKDVAGAILFIYDHHKKQLLEHLIDIQHNFHRLIISTQHVHLDEDHCLEIVVVKGKPASVEKLANLLRSTKGVEHCSLTFTAKRVK
jgi:CopG family nickel-responsive transcriptional regulator